MTESMFKKFRREQAKKSRPKVIVFTYNWQCYPEVKVPPSERYHKAIELLPEVVTALEYEGFDVKKLSEFADSQIAKYLELDESST